MQVASSAIHRRARAGFGETSKYNPSVNALSQVSMMPLRARPMRMRHGAARIQFNTDSVIEQKLSATPSCKKKEQIKIPPIRVGFCLEIAVDLMTHAPDALGHDHESFFPSLSPVAIQGELLP